jgi:tetratricopeptide (TPR) repeat protein
LFSIFKSLGAGVAVLMLLVGLAALGYARWTRAIADGDAAFAAGQLDRAIASYAAAEARFDAVPATRQLFAADYSHAVSNHLSALYRLERYDETIDKAERSPERAAPHFWAGCAFFEKAAAEEKPEAQLGWLTRAEEELRRAVEAAPDDWDTKYDFELATRLAAALRKQPTTPPKQMMQLLRPPAPSAKPARRVG